MAEVQNENISSLIKAGTLNSVLQAVLQGLTLFMID